MTTIDLSASAKERRDALVAEIPELGALGIEEVVRKPGEPRQFLCGWQDRFLVAHLLLRAFTRIEIDGHGPYDAEKQVYPRAIMTMGRRDR